MDRIMGECTTEARRLSQLALGISNALVNLGMLPVWDIAQFLKSAQEVLTMTGLLLEHLREARASSAGPWHWAQAGHCAHVLSLSVMPSFALIIIIAFGADVIYIYVEDAEELEIEK
jgi:hypothetical protein